MVRRLSVLMESLLHRRSLKRWTLAGETAAEADLSTLRLWVGRARSLRRRLDQVIHAADHRLGLPIGAEAMKKPMGTDWSWRPMLWKGPLPVPGIASVPAKALICDGATIFHDCKRSELTVRQIRNTRAVDVAPFGLRMEMFRFDGSFLSLVLDLPDEAARGLRLRHLIRLDLIVEMEKPLEIFARLNIKHGPNVEQILRQIPSGPGSGSGEVMVEFDLAYCKMNEKRVEKLWVDLIFEAPQMNELILRDVTLSRRPRADI
jgi:hypothetical protein